MTDSIGASETGLSNLITQIFRANKMSGMATPGKSCLTFHSLANNFPLRGFHNINRFLKYCLRLYCEISGGVKWVPVSLQAKLYAIFSSIRTSLATDCSFIPQLAPVAVVRSQRLTRDTSIAISKERQVSPSELIRVIADVPAQ